MSQLENLLETFLFEIFSYIHHEELLDVRFLNKNLFRIADKIIQDHLRYSSYYNIYQFKQVQNNYILKNSQYIQHLIINNKKLIEQLKKDKGNGTVISERFNSLKTFEIDMYYDYDLLDEGSINYLITFKHLLFNVQEIKLNIGDVILNEILKLLNPNKLTSICITTKDSTITINNILDFKKFKKLQFLEIITGSIYIKPHDFTFNKDIFPVLNHLKFIVEDNNTQGIDYDMFGNIDQLKSFNFIPRSNDLNSIQFIKDKRKLTNITVNFVIYNNNEIKLNNIIEETLNPILEISIISCIQLNGIFSSNSINANMGLSSFRNFKEIIFNDCIGNTQYFISILKYFPDVEKVSFIKCELSHNHNHVLFLAEYLNSILFCIDEFSWIESNDATKKFFNNVDTLFIDQSYTI